MSDNILKTQKEFFLSNWAIDNRKTVYLILLVLLIGGITAYQTMPKESFPELNIPTIYVGVPYPGVSPEVIESKITDPLEKEINTIKGINKLTSTSVLGFSTIVVEFDFSITSTEALRKVKDKVDIVKGKPEFPKDLPAQPNVFEINFSEFPIMNINLSGDYSSEQLRKYAEDLKEVLKKLDEVDRVDIRGLPEKEISIRVDKFKTESRNISFYDIENAIRSENFTMSAGELLVDDIRKTVRLDGEFKNIADIKNIIVKNENLDIVYLRDIATVSFVDKEPESFAREFMEPVVMLDVIKRPGQNLLETTDKIIEALAQSKNSFLPPNLYVSVTNDQSTQIRDQVSNLENSILLGVILVVSVLLFFLGLRNALFVGVAIPLSMFLSFLVLDSMGVTLNVMVLFSLVMALGMLVDNGIVVVENVYRLLTEGYTLKEAAKKGIGEIAVPIIASTATTLAAFIPLAFWSGIMGEFMKYLPITLIIVLTSSLFVALVINAVLTSVYMKVEVPKRGGHKRLIVISIILIVLGFVLIVLGVNAWGLLLIIFGVLNLLHHFVLSKWAARFQEQILPRLEKSYRDFLSYALKGSNPIGFFLGTVGLLSFSFIILAIFMPKVEFFPINDPNYLNIFIETPVGTDIEKTNKVSMEIEKNILQYVSKYNDTTVIDGVDHIYNFMIKSVIGLVGQGTTDPQSGEFSMASTPHKARITVNFTEAVNRRGISTETIMNEIRQLLKGRYSADVQIIVAKNPNGPPQEPPLNIEIQGTSHVSYNELIEEGQKIKKYIEALNIGGVDKLRLNIETGKSEIPVIINREKARMFGLSTQQIAVAIRTGLFGNEASKYKINDDEYQINLRFEDEFRYKLDQLLSQLIIFRDQTNGKIVKVPVSSVVDVPATLSTFNSVKRKNERRLVTVYSNVISGYNATEVVSQIQTKLKDYETVKGFEWKFTGQQEEMAKQMQFLLTALIIAVFLIFAILITQFNSFGMPFVIITSVVMGLIGVFLGLVIFQMDFIIIMTMMGIITLAGVIVNNAIVLIDYTNLLILRKKEELSLDPEAELNIPDLIECVVQGGKTRLRPVLLTAITTILGLIPMAIGLNIDFISFFNTFDPKIYFGGDNAMFFGPMSSTITFGLTFATFLTLIIVPVMFYLLIRIEYKLNKKGFREG